MTKVQKLIEKFETIGKQNQSMDTSFKGQKFEMLTHWWFTFFCLPWNVNPAVFLFVDSLEIQLKSICCRLLRTKSFSMF
jgi:hypothetical protein